MASSAFGPRILGIAIFSALFGQAVQADLYDGHPFFSSPAEAELHAIHDAEEYVLGPSAGGKWGPSSWGAGATVSWSVMGGGISMALERAGLTSVALDSFMPVGYLDQIRAAFSAWSTVANITFVEVPDSGQSFGAFGATGNIRIAGHYMDGIGGVLAHAYYPKESAALYSIGGDIHFDSDDRWKIGFGGSGFDVFQVAAHEIGHAIGLDHSLTTAALMYGSYTEAFRGPQADDIAGARFIYGAPLVAPQAPALVPEASSWAAGLILILGGVGIWRSRRPA